MKKFILYISFFSVLFFSCKTIDVEKKQGLSLSEENKKLKEKLENAEETLKLYAKEEEYVYDAEPVVYPVTNYVVVDKKDFEGKTKDLTGQDALKDMAQNSVKTLKEYTGGMSVFDYDMNYQYPVFTKKLSMTTIMLNNDEVMNEEDVFLSDALSWEVTGSIWSSDEGDRQLIMIKPLYNSLETDMLVVTDKRIYKFILYSTNKEYQPMVRFKYPTEKKFITSSTKKNKPLSITTNYDEIDYDKVSFNYVIKIPVMQKKPDFTPESVYDDGSFTYILLPESVLQKEFPVFFEKGNDIINYEIHPTVHNLVIINKLIEKITIKCGKQKVTVQKKKGQPEDVSVKR